MMSVKEIESTFNRRSLSRGKKEIIELAMEEMRDEIINMILCSGNKYQISSDKKQELIRDIKNIKIW